MPWRSWGRPACATTKLPPSRMRCEGSPSRNSRTNVCISSPAAFSSELNAAGEEMQTFVREFLDGLPSHLILDGGNLVVAHAGLPQDLHGIDSPRARDVALFGSRPVSGTNLDSRSSPTGPMCTK